MGVRGLAREHIELPFHGFAAEHGQATASFPRSGHIAHPQSLLPHFQQIRIACDKDVARRNQPCHRHGRIFHQHDAVLQLGLGRHVLLEGARGELVYTHVHVVKHRLWVAAFALADEQAAAVLAQIQHGNCLVWLNGIAQ